MKTYKIFNDPVYGFIQIPKGILLDLIDHPFVQRLRRITQLGLTSYVYPGAVHSRFHHALGALHLMIQAIDTLKMKGVSISNEEATAAKIAILLHDIGHGPFSHALEGHLLPMHHEELSLLFMKTLNIEFRGALDEAIQIFLGKHKKTFLTQLVSGQLDMDRMDYLKRDSFFTGVAEGVIGHDRIIKMLNVVNNQLVVEEKAIYSVEKFLMARRLMYWQVYLHKTVVAVEQMLILALKRITELFHQGKLALPPSFAHIFKDKNKQKLKETEILSIFSYIDDVDIIYLLKLCCKSEDEQLAILSNGIIHRRLFKVKMSSKPYQTTEVEKLRQMLKRTNQLTPESVKKLVFHGVVENQAYQEDEQQIAILTKEGDVCSLSEKIDNPPHTEIIKKYYICYPDIIS